MQQVNIKEYFEEFKQGLKKSAIDLNLQNKIKLGIIDATDENDAANAIYIKNKVKDFIEIGWQAKVYKTNNVQEAIKEAIEDNCTSIIIQEPTAEGTPKYHYEDIPLLLDCDGFRCDSLRVPATPCGILCYLEACNFDFKGKNAVVLGRSHIVGKPMADLLLDKDMNVTILHSKTKEEDKKRYLKDADLVIAAVGKAGILTREECPKAIVVDVGINRVDGKLCGDFIENPKMTTDTIWSTPVPGGVGLLTRAALMMNVLMCAVDQMARDIRKGDLSYEENL